MHGHTVCATYVRTYVRMYHGQGDGGTAMDLGASYGKHQSNAIT